MSETYTTIHKKHMDTGAKEDPITLEDLKPMAEAGRETISYLRLNRNIPIIMVYYTTESAYAMFITNRFPKEPETNLPLNPGFIARIQLYHNAQTTLTPEQFLLSTHSDDPAIQAHTDQVKCEMFYRYLRGETTITERLILQIALFIDDANVVKSYTREEAEVLLASASIGQWLLRKSSYLDTDLITNRVISMKASEKVKHFLITHIKGYGYMVSPIFPTRGSIGMAISPDETVADIVVATIGLQVPIPVSILIYPCFINALENIFKDAELVKDQLIGLNA